MSKVVLFDRERRLQEQASTWIARLDRGLTDAESAELREWLAEKASHRAALLKMARIWDQLDVLREISSLFPLEPRRSAGVYAWPIAAAMALVVVGVGLALGSRGLSRLSASGIGIFTHQAYDAVYQTAVGELKVVQLPDQSLVTLNTNTLLRVNYTREDRKLELVKGEAHFKVAKDSRRVFSVTAAASEFRAVGTAFNIRIASTRGVELTVTEGRVEVIAPFSGEAARPVGSEREHGRAGSTEITVDAGKEVVVDPQSQTIQPLPLAKMEEALSWQSGMLMFEGEPLEQALQELSRYSTMRFVIVDDRIRRMPVTGYFKIGDMAGLIAALRKNFDINATKDGDSILLSAN